MNLYSINVNQFVGNRSWSNLSEDEKEERQKIYTPKLIKKIKEYIISEEDIVIIQELPYENYDNLQNEFGKEYVIITPKKTGKAYFITCAIKKSESLWNINEDVNFQFPQELVENKGISYWRSNFKNRIVEIKVGDIYVLGVHIPDAEKRSGALSLWDELIKYYIVCTYFDKKVVIIGDMNVYMSGTVQKRKYYEFLQQGALDYWIESTEENGEKHNADRSTHKSGSRVDYALVSPNMKELITSFEIIDEELSDHSWIKMKIRD